MENPYKIKVGEKLTLNELVKKYIAWSGWNKFNHRDDPHDGCDSKLHEIHHCCTDHADLNTEANVFMSYFKRLTGSVRGLNEPGGALSPMIMKKIVQQYGVDVDIKRLSLVFGYTPEGWDKVKIDEEYFAEFHFFSQEDAKRLKRFKTSLRIESNKGDIILYIGDTHRGTVSKNSDHPESGNPHGKWSAVIIGADDSYLGLGDNYDTEGQALIVAITGILEGLTYEQHNK